MLVFFDVCRESLCELVGAGSALHAATNARKTLDSLGYGVASYERGNALGVAVATANKANLSNNAILNCNFNSAGADSLCCVSKTIHVFIFLSV